MTKVAKNWRKKGYLIPEVINPDENICVCVPVPKEWGHIRAFLGQLTELSKWQTWQPDGTTNATQSARRWFDIVECVSEEIDCIMANGCGCDGDNVTNRRYTADGHLETSTDNGETWQNADADDPRFNSAVFSPLPGADGDDKKCVAANAMVAWLRAEQDKASDILGAAGGAAGLVAAVVAALVATGVGVVAAVVIGIMGAILNAVAAGGQTVFDDSFTTQIWDDLLCSIFCNIRDDGSFDEAGWQNVIGETLGFSEYPANEWLSYMIKTAGLVGATNMARSGLQGSASCESCDCDPIECGTELQITEGTLVSITTEGGCTVMRVASATNPSAGGFEAVSIGVYGQGAGEYPCCHIFAWTQGEGSTITTYGWTDCGGGLHDPGNPETHDVAHAYWSNGIGNAGFPFEVAIVFGTGCT